MFLGIGTVAGPGFRAKAILISEAWTPCPRRTDFPTKLCTLLVWFETWNHTGGAWAPTLGSEWLLLFHVCSCISLSIWNWVYYCGSHCRTGKTSPSFVPHQQSATFHSCGRHQCCLWERVAKKPILISVHLDFQLLASLPWPRSFLLTSWATFIWDCCCCWFYQVTVRLRRLKPCLECFSCVHEPWFFHLDNHTATARASSAFHVGSAWQAWM